MKPVLVKDVIQAVNGTLVGPALPPDAVITNITTDSRTVTPGSLFIAIRGQRSDGHDYVASAMEKGAVCCMSWTGAPGVPIIQVRSVADAIQDLAAWYRSILPVKVVGITGSVGKTTTKEMVASVLAQKYRVLKTQGNLNNELGVPLTLFRLEPEHQVAVVEMGISDFGEMTRLARMARPDMAVMTVIGSSHLEFLHDRAGVLRAKGEIFSFLPKDGLAVLNGDDDLLAAYDPGVRCIRFGHGENCDFRAVDQHIQGLSGTACRIVYDGGEIPVTIPAYGQHMVMAALPAAAIGIELGLSPQEIAQGIAAYQPVGRRCNVTDTGYITLIDDCYNANPDSVRSAIASLAALPSRHVAILGDMKELGPDSPHLHQAIGLACRQAGVTLIACGALAADYAAGYGSGALYFAPKAALLSELPSLIHPGDQVLVKASHSMAFEEISEALLKLGK